jgi:Fic family protein
MARRISEEDLQAIIDVVREPGATAQHIARTLGIPLRTLQYRLKQLVAAGRLAHEGKGPSAKYRIPAEGEREQVIGGQARIEPQGDLFVPVSETGAEIQKYVRQPVQARTPVGYSREFLDAYRPNKTAYLSAKEREHLHKIGTPQIAQQPAGTYAKQILSRLLIDLSWNSSRLEGNTYSLLDTKRLIEFGQEAAGKDQLEAQMILNHKDAIEFLVSEAQEIGFNRYSILNLHGILASNLLDDPDAPGRLRRIGVEIGGSVFRPLEVPQQIEECFDQILATAAAIKDPFEQAFFVMVQLPYLQPFDDVNKRVSRLSANIPLIRNNLSPLSFADVPKQTYTEGMLGVYELNKVDLLKDVFIWAYERSASRYAAVRQSLGEPDPFKLRHRAALRQIIGEVVRSRLDKKSAGAHIAEWSEQNIDAAERDRFREVAETELLSLHEGNFARYQIKPSEFASWQRVWSDAKI